MLKDKQILRKSLEHSFFVITLLSVLFLSFYKLSIINSSYNLTSSSYSTCTLNDGNCASCYTENSSDCLQSTNNQQTLSGASQCKENGNNCNIFSDYLNPIINVLSGVIVLVAIASIIVAGIMYSSSGGDAQKAAKAKSRIINTLLALLAYIFLYSFLQFLIPGGLLNK